MTRSDLLSRPLPFYPPPDPNDERVPLAVASKTVFCEHIVSTRRNLPRPEYPPTVTKNGRKFFWRSHLTIYQNWLVACTKSAAPRQAREAVEADRETAAA
jgi:hypothetical protein